ncbi:MAG: hypothetical protein JNL18_17135 [Planctomycetaceae bacterium]|nr:hypothetical protein [Planctomycetaceae bacterium]
MIEGKPIEAGDFHRWEREQDALPITSNGQLCTYGVALVGWLGRDGSFAQDGLYHNPLTLFPPSTDPDRNWQDRHNYAVADLKQATADFENLKASALGLAGAGTFGDSDWRPSYGEKPGDIEAMLTQIAEAVRVKREALEDIEANPSPGVAKQREEQAKRKANTEFVNELMRRDHQERMKRLASIKP